MLPRQPDDVLHVDVAFDVNGRLLRAGLWMLFPDLQTWTSSWLTTFFSDFMGDVLSGLTGCMHSGASVATCRLTIAGNNPVNWTGYAPTNVGAYEGGQADSIACGVYVVSGGGGRGSGTRFRVPGCPDAFIDDNWRLSSTAVSRLFDLCDDITRFARTARGPEGLPAVLGTLQRRTAHGDLPIAVFDPAVLVVPSFRVELLSRRMPKSRGVSGP